MSKQKKKQTGKPVRPQKPGWVLDALDDIEELIEAEDWEGAHLEALALALRTPIDIALGELLVLTSANMHDWNTFERVAVRLRELDPKSPDFAHNLTVAYARNRRPILTLRASEEFVSKWPDHSESERVRGLIAQMRPMVEKMLEDAGYNTPEGWVLGARHEEARSLFSQGLISQARRLAEQVVKSDPMLAPAWITIAEAHAQEGRYTDAIETARRVLEFDPDNVDALSHIVRYALYTGRREEAMAAVERIKASSDRASNWAADAAEALSLVGDWASVLTVYEDAMRDESKLSRVNVLRHYAAAAMRSLGRDEDAREMWMGLADPDQRVALLADENLEDMDRAIGDRHGPIVFHATDWFARPVLDDFAGIMQQLSGASDEAAERAGRKLLRQHPELIPTTELIMDLADPETTAMVLGLGEGCRIPELLELARKFALGHRGSDKLRMRALSYAQRARILPPGLIKLWQRGEWREIRLHGYEIYAEAEPTDMPPAADSLYQAAMDMHLRGDNTQAMTLLKKALEIAPGNLTLRNNIAAMTSVLGRNDEAMEMIEQIHHDAPDYLFGRCNLAGHYARTGRITEAEALLAPVIEAPRLHRTEYCALAGAEIDLALAKDNVEGARSWGRMLAEVDPNHPFLDRLERRIGPIYDDVEYEDDEDEDEDGFEEDPFADRRIGLRY